MSRQPATTRKTRSSVASEPAGWTDVSSFSAGAKDRTPFSWRLRAGAFTISLHRHKHYDPQDWLLSCEPFCDKRLLAAREVEQAKAEALAYIDAQLRQALDELSAEKDTE